MQNEIKAQMVGALETIANEKIRKWEKVKEVAKDLIAWLRRDPTRFVIEIPSAVSTGAEVKIFYVRIAGTEKYAVYGEEVNNMTLVQLFERFFGDMEVMVAMIKKLASTIVEAAEGIIKELKEASQ